MSTTPDTGVQSWITSQLADTTEEGNINRIELYHAIDGSSPEIMCSVTVRDGDDAEDICQQVWDAAVTDAETRMSGVVQRYVITSYRPDHKEPEAQHPFIMTGKATSDIMGGNTEGPNPSGHLGQLMRHAEKSHEVMVRMCDMTAGRLARDLESSHKRNSYLEKEREDNAESIRQLNDRKHERDMDIRREEAKEQRHEQMMGVLMGMAPLLASKFLGGKDGQALALPAAAGARDSSLHQLLKNLNEDEIKGILSAMSPSNQLIMMELYQAHQQVDQSKKENSKSENQN